MNIKIQLSNENGQSNFEGSYLTEQQADTLINGFIASLGLAKEQLEVPVNPSWADLAEPIRLAPFEGNEGIAIVPDQTEASFEDMLAASYQESANIVHTQMDDETQHIEMSSFGTNLGDKLTQAFLSKPTELTKPVAEQPKEVKAADVKANYAETQDFYTTGIKYKTVKGVENVPTYKCRWECADPTCRSKGTHYIPEGTETVYCYNCNTKLIVEDATDLGFPNRDAWGNFYVAYDEAEDNRAWHR